MADFLQLSGKTFLVFGVANRKSVGWFVGKSLEGQGARVLYSVRSEVRRKSLEPQLGAKNIFVCDVEHEGAVERLAAEIAAAGHAPLQGIVHSIAFANYSEGPKPFHETRRQDFLQSTAVSAFSVVEIARAFKPHLAPNASVVTIGISSLLVTPDNYGYMGPIKAALESAIRFLAKSFSADTEVRFNAIGAGPLKTSASAGIPGYIESYLFAEKLTFRKRNVQTQEVANAVLFLLSDRSSGINGATLVVDAGLGSNYFDQEIIRLSMRPPVPPASAASAAKMSGVRRQRSEAAVAEDPSSQAPSSAGRSGDRGQETGDSAEYPSSK
ncbi:MAG: SDR family oxidoreductase [Opitutaceae bacterium]|nr:SDR family oxidoreductase [Opitutaceae bacterium]